MEAKRPNDERRRLKVGRSGRSTSSMVLEEVEDDTMMRREVDIMEEHGRLTVKWYAGGMRKILMGTRSPAPPPPRAPRARAPRGGPAPPRGRKAPRRRGTPGGAARGASGGSPPPGPSASPRRETNSAGRKASTCTPLRVRLSLSLSLSLARARALALARWCAGEDPLPPPSISSRPGTG
jgi:hypothetical protein